MSAPAGERNWSNQSIWTGDNLDIMRGMNSASVDLIYLDPVQLQSRLRGTHSSPLTKSALDTSGLV